MKKRIFAALLCIFMLSASAGGFSSAAAAAEENVIASGSLSDALDDFSNVYAAVNLTQVTDNALLTNEVYNDSGIWTVTDTSQKAEVIYKAAEGRTFYHAEVEFSRMTNIKYPVISYSEDGVNYTDLTTRMTEARGDDSVVEGDWTKITAGDKTNLGQHVYRAAKEVPQAAKYIKVEIQASSSVRPVYLKDISLKLGVFNVLSEDTTDELSEFDKIYTETNIKRVENNDILECEAYGDDTLWTVDDKTKAAEIVYAIDEGVFPDRVYLEISRNEGLIYPVLSYSEDGETYIDLTERMTEEHYENETVKKDWTRVFNAGSHNFWQWGYETTKEIPEGARFIKVEMQANSFTKPFYFREIRLYVNTRHELTESITDELENLTKLWGKSNVRTDGSGAVTVENASDKSEMIYKSESAKQISRVSAEITVQAAIRFPVISYSRDGNSYENVNIPMAQPSLDDIYDWKSVGEGKFRLDCDLPSGVKFIKIWTQKNSAESVDALEFNKAVIELEGYGGICEAVTDTCVSFEYVYASSNMSVAETSTLSERGLDDVEAFCLSEPNKKAEVVYMAAEGKEFSELTVEMARQNPLKFPMISYSKDNITYTDFTTLMEEQAYSGGGWTHDGTVYKEDGTSSYYNKFHIDAQFPVGTKYVKIWVADGAVSRKTDLYIRNVELSIRNSGNYSQSLYEEYKDYFDIGMAVEARYLPRFDDLVKSQANVLTTENAGKSWIHYGENDWTWDGADAILEYAEKNNQKVRWHTLVCPDFFDAYAENGNTQNAWFFKDEEGNPLLDENRQPVEGARELTLKRLENHIKTIMTRYKGRVYAYDVINEAYMDEGVWRSYTDFWRMLGREDDSWMNDCFRWAHEADPDAVLILNDNAFASSTKKADVIYNKIKEMRDEGIPVQLGIQMHYGPDSSLEDIEALLERFSGLCDIYITEHDLKMSSYETLDGTTFTNSSGLQATINSGIRYPDYMYDEMCELQAKKYASLFDLFRKYSEHIPCVGLWGVADGQNDYTNQVFPLTFDELGNEKPGYYSVLDIEGQLPRWEKKDGSPRIRLTNHIVDEENARVRIIADTGGEEQNVTVALYHTTENGTEKLFGDKAELVGSYTAVSDNECSFTFPIDGFYDPSDSLDTSRFVIKQTIGSEEALDYFYYVPESAYDSSYTIVEDFNDFEKEYEVNQMSINSNLSNWDDDFAGFQPQSKFQPDRDKYVEYKIPDGHEIKSITLDAYVHDVWKYEKRPVVMVSKDGESYQAVSSLSDWPIESEITDKVYPGQYSSDRVHHFRYSASDFTGGFKYVKIHLNEFTDAYEVYLSKLRIETVPDGKTREYTLSVDGEGNASVSAINGRADEGLNLFIAEYSALGALINCERFTVDLDAEGTAVEKSLPTKGGDYFKAFLLGKDLISPICGSASSKIN